MLRRPVGFAEDGALLIEQIALSAVTGATFSSTIVRESPVPAHASALNPDAPIPAPRSGFMASISMWLNARLNRPPYQYRLREPLAYCAVVYGVVIGYFLGIPWDKIAATASILLP